MSRSRRNGTIARAQTICRLGLSSILVAVRAGVVCLTVIVLSASTPATAESPLQTGLRQEILDSALSVAGGVDLVAVEGNRYLVAVGVANVGAGTAQDLQRARRVARLRAHAAFTAFVRGEQVSSDSRLTQTIEVTTQQGATNVRASEELLEVQRSLVKGYLPPLAHMDEFERRHDAPVIHALYMELTTEDQP